MLAPQLVSPLATSSPSLLTLVLAVLLVVVVVAVLGLVALAAVSRRWLRREAARSGATSTSPDQPSDPADAVPTLVRAHEPADLADAVAAQVQRDPAGLLLVARAEDVLPSERQLQEAARVLDRPDTGFVTFTDDDTPESRVRRDHRLVLAAPGPVAVRAEAVADVGGWDGDVLLPESELSARMLRSGWYGASLGAVPDSTCDVRARERQVAWAVVRRHPGLLVPGPRHAGNELSARERLVLLATAAAALTTAPTAAERAWVRGRSRDLRPRARGLRLPGVIPAVGVALTVVAAAALVAVMGAAPTPPGDGAAASSSGSAAEPVPSGATYLVGQRLQARSEAVVVPTRAGARRGATHRQAAHRRAAHRHAVQHRAAQRRAAQRRTAAARASRRQAAPARTAAHRSTATRPKTPAAVTKGAPAVRGAAAAPATPVRPTPVRPTPVRPTPVRPTHASQSQDHNGGGGDDQGRPESPKKAHQEKKAKPAQQGESARPSKRRP